GYVAQRDLTQRRQGAKEDKREESQKNKSRSGRGGGHPLSLSPSLSSFAPWRLCVRFFGPWCCAGRTRPAQLPSVLAVLVAALERGRVDHVGEAVAVAVLEVLQVQPVRLADVGQGE